VASWIDCIAAEAQKRLSQSRILYLSQIPYLLERNGFDPRSVLSGRSLRTALEFEGDDKIILVNNPESALEWGVVPKIDMSLLDLRALFRSAPARESTEAPRFESWFWGAFVKNLPEGRKRYLGNSRFYDLLDGEAPPPRSIEIDRDEIANLLEGTKADPDAVIKNINSWAARNRIEQNQYYRTKADRINVSAKPEKKITPFDDFDDEDLRRILVPLDIVFRILRQR
jgi:hypothetical protein